MYYDDMHDSYPDYDACSEFDSPFSYEGEYADLLRDAEWEYYADVDRECYDW